MRSHRDFENKSENSQGSDGESASVEKGGFLCLTIGKQETIQIGPDIQIRVLKTSPHNMKIGIKARKDFKIESLGHELVVKTPSHVLRRKPQGVW